MGRLVDHCNTPWLQSRRGRSSTWMRLRPQPREALRPQCSAPTPRGHRLPPIPSPGQGCFASWGC
eukprot:8137955-Alexandrium_andersonii.AAC.1